MLEPSTEAINALAGELEIISGKAEFTEIQDGESIISAWVERPSIQNKKIVFAGIIPGGFSGQYTPYSQAPQPGLILKVGLASPSDGEVIIAFKNPQAFYREGVSAPITLLPETLKITFHKGTVSNAAGVTEDKIPPQNLTLDVMRLGEGADGWFALFSADDFDSGLQGFEIQEQPGNVPDAAAWRRAESPQRLEDQKRKSYIFVKAIDRSGNEAAISLPPQENSFWTEWSNSVGLALLALALLLIIYRWRRRL